MKVCFFSGPKLKKMEGKVGELEKKVQELVRKCDLVLEKAGRAPTIDFVYVESLHVDRLEFANNFGALGIKELGGMLNIGVNCRGGDFPEKGGGKEERKSCQPGEKSSGGRSFPGEKRAPPGGGGVRENRAGPACNIRFGAPGDRKADGE
ncbi:MAG: hypothetical protein ACUVSK_04960 [Desulfotomaculales bacterium]